MASSTQSPTSDPRERREKEGTARTEKSPSTPLYGQLKTPQDAAFASVSSRLGDLGNRLQSLSGFGSKTELNGQEGEESNGGKVEEMKEGTETKEAKEKEGAAEGEQAGEMDYDPFTGAPLQRLIPLQASLPSFGGSSSSINSSSAALPGPSLSHQLWSHLARVRRLQAELAAAHIAMENVTGKSGLEMHDMGVVEADRNMGMGEEAVEGDGRREERGRERREMVQGIMAKLDELSKAVTAYHGVVTPSLDLSISPSRGRTRSNTVNKKQGTSFHDPAFSDTDSSMRRATEDPAVNALGFGVARSASGSVSRSGTRPAAIITGKVLGEGNDMVQSPMGGAGGFEVYQE